MTGIEKLRAGDFNNVVQQRQPDGSLVIILSSRRYPEVYRLKVKDLYGPNEEVLSEEVVKK